MLWKHRRLHQITKIATRDKTITQLPEKISNYFHRFYSDLYHLPTGDTEGERTQRTTFIWDHLNNNIATTLMQDTVEELETPISLEEL
ncbi:Hypothetical predicted protein [Pelobates cultripes]|uniref:Uncharacterized protein n=1 Tax=Pelobates cultripes TaxID=61616 RepID=A0AAD1S8W7_PELCU|nr:Hypothetical predicted protein [Pelobates cultripes]